MYNSKYWILQIAIQLYGMIMLPDYDNDNFANDKSFIVACNLRIPIYRVNVRFCHTTDVSSEPSIVERATSE